MSGMNDSVLVAIQRMANQQCADCDSESSLTEIEPGIYKITIAHDETCPWLKAAGNHAG